MSNPLVHAERSAKKWGGQPEDYLEIHQWFDWVTYCFTFQNASFEGEFLLAGELSRTASV